MTFSQSSPGGNSGARTVPVYEGTATATHAIALGCGRNFSSLIAS
jgi:hypothetical protein